MEPYDFMAILHMSGPRLDASTGVFLFRQHVPKAEHGRWAGTPVVVNFPETGTDTAHTARARIGKGEVNFSLRTRDKATARSRWALAKATVDGLLEALRSTAPIRLSEHQASAIAGVMYRDIAKAIGDNPGVAAGVFFEAPGRPFGSSLLIPSPETSESVVGGFADAALATHGLVNIDGSSRLKVVTAIERALLGLGDTLSRNAAGDWSPDTNLTKFPLSAAVKPGAGPAWKAVIGAWSRRHEQGDGSPGTRRSWCSLMNRFAEHANVPPAEVSATHVRSWLASRTADGANVQTTIVKKDIAAIKAVFTTAIGAGLFPDGYVNPTNAVQSPKQSAVSRKRREMLSYSDAEVALILTAAEREADPLRRWVPLLCVTTGSRVATMVNLRGCDVKKIGGIWCASIDPDAGPVKTAPSIRDVPLHPNMIAAGFLDFVASRGDARLFYDDTDKRRLRYRLVPGQPPQKARHRRGSDTPATSRGDNAAKRLAAWIKTIPGLSVGMAVRKAPCHAFRKWTSTALVIAKVDPILQRCITGHAAADVAGRYPDPKQLIAGMRDAIATMKLPMI
jgi:hypothetical protein